MTNDYKKFKNTSLNSEQKKASQDAYFDQQALYNRAFHHIQ